MLLFFKLKHFLSNIFEFKLANKARFARVSAAHAWIFLYHWSYIDANHESHTSLDFNLIGLIPETLACESIIR